MSKDYPKPVEKVNKTTNSVDLTKLEVNLIDIASPNMTPEASKVVSDALERSAEVMNKTKPVESGELESLLHINGCQQRTAGYNEAKDGRDIDTDDVERLEKIAYDEVLNILAQEKAKWVAELRELFTNDEIPTINWHREPFECVNEMLDKLEAKLLDKENI